VPRTPAGASWLSLPSIGNRVLVLQSDFWNYNSVAIVDGDQALLFDPGVRPAEIESIGLAARDGDRRRVSDLVVTHSHHDHIRGWHRYPEATVWMPAAVERKGDAAKKRDLAFKASIDRRFGIEDAGYTFPVADRSFEEEASVQVGSLTVELHHLPGHSACSSIAIVPELRTLISSDYLVSPGLPYCRWLPEAFDAAVQRLGEMCRTHEIETVIPGHNAVIQGHAAVLAALEEERTYFAFLRECASSLLTAGHDAKDTAHLATQAMRERRGRKLDGRERQDGDNARRVVAELS